jgi:hypothetical protein
MYICPGSFIVPVKKALVIIAINTIVFFSACLFSNNEQKSMKDYDQHMLDINIYHENLGDALLSKNKSYASWFVNDMDSIFGLMSKEFTTHRKLKKPFKYHYEKRLAPYMRDLKAAIERNEWARSVETYSMLTKQCNGCHIDHKIDKKIRDVTLGNGYQ